MMHFRKPAETRAAGRAPSSGVLLLLAAIASFCPAAHANDRPFQVARTAVMEDDEQVWSFESWAQRRGSVRGLSFEPEYTFDSANSIQFEVSRFIDRRGQETGHEAEVELKHLFNNIARDGYGWGVSAAVGAERSRGEGTVRSLGLKLPLSISIGDDGAYLHLNGGITKASNSRRAWTASAGIEREVFKRTVLFAEIAHEGDLRFAQIGARHWLRREKLAIDLSLQQQRSEGQRASGFVLGVGWYDL
ncbi:hypothetical protein BH11PSE8_BH11PSE8_48020 [soil metagenome]